MARHHTKDKGDLGVAKVHADLVSKGFTVLFPATEHAAFDLVAYADGEFYRLQVKYRSARSGADPTHTAHPSPFGLRRVRTASTSEFWMPRHFAMYHDSTKADGGCADRDPLAERHAVGGCVDMDRLG